jgi:guanylate kinase
MRANEVDGVDYIFVSVDVFRHMVDEGQMLEHAEVYGNLYGVPRAQVAEALERGLDVMVEIDVQGAATLRRVVPDAVFIFMAAPSMDRLERRLQRRKTESPEALRVRLETARSEISQAPRFDYIVINADDRIDDTVRDIESVMERERQIKGDGNAGT